MVLPSVLAFSLDDRRIVIGANDRKIRIWDVDGGNLLDELEGHDGAITCLTYFRADKLASSSEDASIVLWDLNQSAPALCRRGEEPRLESIETCYLTDGKLFATSGLETVRLWDTSSGLHVGSLQNRACQRWVPNCMATNHGSPELFAAGDFEGVVRIWELPLVLGSHRSGEIDLPLLRSSAFPFRPTAT